MKNNWSNKEAEEYIKYYKKNGFSEDIALRVYSTRIIGRNKDLVVHGGGNTSVKTTIRDIDGNRCRVLCVKGSGWDMAEIEPEGLPAVKLKPLLSYQNKESLTDEDMVAIQRRNLININSPNPSVETFVHAFLPYKFVDHTHSNAIVMLTNRSNSKKICEEIFGSKVGIVPYVMPGFKLAREVNKIYKKNPNIDCLILLKHGVLTFSDNVEESYKLMIKYVTLAEKALIKLKIKKNQQVKKTIPLFKPHEISPILRGLLSDNSKKKFILNFRSNQNLNYFINNKDIRRCSSFNMATPDHVIRIKPFPLIISPKDKSSIKDFKRLAEKSLAEYRDKYTKYFLQNLSKSDEKKIMLDTSPRIILIQNFGLFSVGENYKSAITAGDLAEVNAKVISKVEESTKFNFISNKDLFDIEYWSLEQSKLGKIKNTLEGHIVVITGGLGAIGFETYKVFKRHGAEVVLLDYNKKKVNEMKNKLNDLCLHCDVRSRKSVKKVFREINKKLGGIDILISNAGNAIDGAIADVSDKDLRNSFEYNFFSHQNCASEAVKIMKKQNIEGCLLFNISKQSVNPGKNFGPYGLPKSALLSLCKQYAIDYGSFGIRSNGVNADRIRSNLLNSKMVKSRSRARGISEIEYMKGNLLEKEVMPEDVAKAFFDLALSKKTTGSIFTVDGGNIAASLR